LSKLKFLAFFTLSLIIFSGTAWADTTYTATGAGEHAIELSSGTKTYDNPTVIKTGDVRKI